MIQVVHSLENWICRKKTYESENTTVCKHFHHPTYKVSDNLSDVIKFLLPPSEYEREVLNVSVSVNSRHMNLCWWLCLTCTLMNRQETVIRWNMKFAVSRQDIILCFWLPICKVYPFLGHEAAKQDFLHQASDWSLQIVNHTFIVL
jgi:hypothetical protein